MKNNRKKSKQKSVLREWVEAIVIAFVLAMFIRTFFIQAFKIPSGSMIPTLKPGDRILVNKLFYGPQIPIINVKLPMFIEPKQGDVIVFIYPESANNRTFANFKHYLDDDDGPLYLRLIKFLKDTQKKDYIKRLIGLPNDLLEIKNGDIYINGQISQNSQIRKGVYFNEGPYGAAGQKIKVPADSYYCLGDNSSASRDSRYWGFVNKKFLIGKAVLIYWPLNRIRIIR
ncbi:MAG: signal peptidase I [Candidatus Omnitrophota bacterium]